MTKEYHEERDERDSRLNTYTTERVLLELQRLQKQVDEYNLSNYHDVLRFLLDNSEHSRLEVEDRNSIYRS